MLHKIIYKNFKSNIRKYILFFVSNIIAVAELFIFWGLNDVVVRAVTEPSIMMGIKSDFVIAVGLITVVTILLMVFSMRYYIKLRAKDYGTFIMLGMKKKMSYMLLFAEYIIGCIGSLLIGILSGNLLLYGILYCLNQYNPQIITLHNGLHGYGMKNIQDIVKKYDGIFEYKVYEDHLIFMISIYNN